VRLLSRAAWRARLQQRGRTQARWRGRALAWVHPGALGADVRIGRGVVIEGTGIRVGDGAVVGDGVLLAGRAPGSVVVGPKTFLNGGVHVSSTGDGVVIGTDVLFGPHVVVVDQDHAFGDPTRPIARQGMAGGGRVEIGDGSWVAAGAVVLGPTRIAPGSVVGANAVVRGDFPRRCVLVGAPARVARYLDDELDRDLARPSTPGTPSTQERNP
jgi:acetyltransferase-like isoleucine patch superfamily enzyme